MVKGEKEGQRLLKMNRTILDEARAVVYEDRRFRYGQPYSEFCKVAKIWESILNITVTAEQVGLCLVGLKLVRESFKHDKDNLIDICGYCCCIQEIIDNLNAVDYQEDF